jgi:hypothetical protein
VPDDGPVTPRLRMPQKDISAIGFTVSAREQQFDEQQDE